MNHFRVLLKWQPRSFDVIYVSRPWEGKLLAKHEPHKFMVDPSTFVAAHDHRGILKNRLKTALLQGYPWK